MSPSVMKKLAKPMLFFAAFIWGVSFFIMKNALDSMPVFYLLAIRFTIGGGLLALLCVKKWKLFTRDYIWRGAALAGLLFPAYAIQTFGLMFTTPSKNAFLTTIYCVMVPFLYWAVSKKRPDRYNVIAAFLCVTGVGLVSLSGALSFNLGDGLTLLCAVFYASSLVAVTELSRGKDIYLISIAQFGFVALYASVCGLLTEQFPFHVFTDPAMLWPLFYLCVLATTVALVFQNVGQVWSDPASAAVLLSLESVFGVVSSVIFYGDKVTGQMAAGFVCIFIAVLCSETKFSFLHKKKPADVQEAAQ